MVDISHDFSTRRFDPRSPVGKLKDLADYRVGISPGKQNPVMHKAFLPKLSPSAPNLHDFGSKAHLARLDIAYEKMDTCMEQKLEQLRSAIDRKTAELENMLNGKVGAVEEQLSTVLDLVRKPRALDSTAQSEILLRRIASCEERLSEVPAQGGTQALREAELRAKISSLDERLSLMSSAQGGKDIEGQRELRARVTVCEDGLQRNTSGLSELRERFVSLTGKLAIGECKSFAQVAVERQEDDSKSGSDTEAVNMAADMHQSNEVSVSQRMQNRICDARAESLRAAVSDLAGQQEALRIEKSCLADKQGKEKAVLVALEERCVALQEQFSEVQAVALEERFASLQEQLSEVKAVALEQRFASLQEQLSELKAVALEDRFAALQEELSEVQAVAQEARTSFIEAEKFKTKCVKAQVFLEDKVASFESQVDDHQQNITTLLESLRSRIDTCQKIQPEVHDLNQKQEAFTASLIDLSKQLQRVQDRNVDIESQLHAFGSSFMDVHDQSVESTCSDSYQPSNGKRASATGVPLLCVGKRLAEMERRLSQNQGPMSLSCGPDSNVRIAALEEEMHNTAEAVSHIEQSLSSVASQQDFQTLRIRVEGGFKAMLARLEAVRFVLAQEDAAADQIFRMFSMKTDSRIDSIENHINKNDNMLDRVIEKSHLKVKTLAVPAKCPQCGTFNASKVVNCKGCGFQRAQEKVKSKAEKHQKTKAVIMWQREQVNKQTFDYNAKLLSVVFDVWSRGDKAQCLTSYRTQRLSQSPRPGRTSLSPSPTATGASFNASLRSSPVSESPRGTPRGTVLSRSVSPSTELRQLTGTPQKRNRFFSNPFSR